MLSILNIREMQIKTTMRNHLITVKMSIVKKTRNKIGKDMEEAHIHCS
jgi:hypothetical protein